jgi:hypothetical protein
MSESPDIGENTDIGVGKNPDDDGPGTPWLGGTGPRVTVVPGP